MKLQTMREKIDPCEHCCPLETETDKCPFREIPVSSERAVIFNLIQNISNDGEHTYYFGHYPSSGAFKHHISGHGSLSVTRCKGGNVPIYCSWAV
jgi:hypothetical protein